MNNWVSEMAEAGVFRRVPYPLNEFQWSSIPNSKNNQHVHSSDAEAGAAGHTGKLSRHI